MFAPAPQQSADTHSRALAINLESSIYGTFAEIGAGQEVARWFLSVGAASGTVAQAISAYDKTVSDDTYGAGTRYVSKERLLAMLDHEYQLLLSRLAKERGSGTRFFVFADTVATRNYQGTNEQHGWLGFRFQADPGCPPNDVLLHITLRDPTAQLQQQAIGTLGVNLIYALTTGGFSRSLSSCPVRGVILRTARNRRSRADWPRFRWRRFAPVVPRDAAQRDVPCTRLRFQSSSG